MGQLSVRQLPMAQVHDQTIPVSFLHYASNQLPLCSYKCRMEANAMLLASHALVICGVLMYCRKALNA